jgi:alpha-L-rhamnosidase
MDRTSLAGQMLLAVLAAITVLLAAYPAPAQNAPRVDDLRCEYLRDPLGIDVTQPRLSWTLAAGPRGHRQGAYRILVASSPDTLRKDRGDLWDSGKVSSDQSVFVPYGGRSLASGERCHWKVRVWDGEGRESQWSAPALWSMGLLRESDWHSRWIGQERPAEVKEGTPLPFPWLRKTFDLKQKPERATAYVNALGYYELYVNGKKVDDHVLAPTVSDYSRRSLYVTHDVTDYLTPGKNCLALWLGRGWYVRGHPGVIHDGPLVRAQVEMSLPDGSPVRIGTDQTWKARESPLRPLGRGLAFGDYGGEQYDARRELPGWNATDFDDSGWQQAALFDPPRVPAVAQMVEPNRIMETLKPVKVQETAPGVYLFDMGRNFTGWFELRLPAGMAAGKTVKLEYSDFPLPADGGRWRTHNQRDEVIMRGAGEQVFRSRFNYHGFGYVRVTGLERAPSVEDGKGYLIHTSYEPAGEFACSNELLNRIYRMTTWTYRSLTLGGYVVDCPTRERLGYGGDAGTSHETGMFNFGVGGLYNRWLGDWRAAQHPETGDLPYTAPHYQDQGGGGPMWSGFVVTVPWEVYVHYGDRRALETNYPTVQKWLAFLQTKTVDNVLERYNSYGMRMPQWNFLGDWVPPRPSGGAPPPFGHPESARFINNCHYLYQLQLAAKIARILGKSDDAATYESRASTLSRALHERFYKPGERSYATGEQPYLAFPLLVGIVPPELRQPVMQNLEETIRVKDRGHINAGMHGTYFLLEHLMAQDRNDLIYQMVNQRDFPGWGYMLEQGATTSWEDWQGNGSRIHDTLISIGSWFIQGIGGIRADESAPGFRHFVIKPAPVGDLTFARTRYRSPYGPIISDWRIENGVFHLDVTVPPGATATVYVPASDAGAVTEGGRPAGRAAGVRSEGVREGKAVYRVTSGRYAFASKLAR